MVVTMNFDALSLFSGLFLAVLLLVFLFGVSKSCFIVVVYSLLLNFFS